MKHQWVLEGGTGVLTFPPTVFPIHVVYMAKTAMQQLEFCAYIKFIRPNLLIHLLFNSTLLKSAGHGQNTDKFFMRCNKNGY